MKSWILAAGLVCFGALAGCSSSDTVGGTGGGSAGTGGAGGTSNGGVGGDSPTSTTTSSSSGGLQCDNNADGCGRDSNSGCSKCAVMGPCKPFILDCQQNTNCGNLLTCLGQCPPPPDGDMCVADCRTAAREGADLYDAILKCIVCDQCPTDCDAANESICTGP